MALSPLRSFLVLLAVAAQISASSRSKNLRTPNVTQAVAESDAAINASGHQLLEAADDSSTAGATKSDE